MSRISILFIILFISELLLGQEIAIGQWRVHLPYYNCISVAPLGSKIFAATPTGIFYYDTQDNSIERVSKINGLSDLDINILAADPDRKQLLVGYKNGNIDIISEDGKTQNISDIKRKNITGDKTINNVLVVDRIAYISTGFGIVLIDLFKKEIKDTYLINTNGGYINVKEVAVLNSEIFAATEKGLFKATLSAPNLANYQYWSLVTQLPQGNINSITTANGSLYANYTSSKIDQDTLYQYQNGSWSYFNSTAVQNARRIQNIGGKLVRITWYGAAFFNLNGSIDQAFGSYNFGGASPYQIYQDNSGKLWVADFNFGLVQTTNKIDFSFIVPNGPTNTSSTSYSALSDGTLYVARGNTDDTWGNFYLSPEIYVFKEGEWSVINKVNNPLITDMLDVLTVVINPNDEKQMYAGSYFNGLIEFKDKQATKIYNENNSTLERNFRCGISGMSFDNVGNLWMVNTISNKPLHVLKADGNWKSFTLNGINNTVFTGRLLIDDFGKKWIQLPRGTGLFVYDDNGTIDDVSDDKQTILNETIGKGGLHTTTIYAMAKDLGGNIWIGTDKGISVFNNPGGVFTGSVFDAQQIKIEQNGVVSYLLESEEVTAIAVDKANRKWIGTRSAGVFLVSEDGTSEIKHFDTQNSPILSNSIMSIGINHTTGEVFLGTEKGIISYKSDATEPTKNFNGVYAYPNPVLPNYTGVIAIKNLVENAIVKIADTQGNIVYETKALGGQATWNGRKFNGDKVSSGVYLVFSSSTDGLKTDVTKILFIK